MSEEATRRAVAALWERSRPQMMDRVATVERAARALAGGDLPLEVRRDAEREAHKLAGAVGTFGFWDASVLAREIELLLQQKEPLARADAVRLTALTTQLRHELEQTDSGVAKARRSEDAARAASEQARLLVVGGSTDLAARIAAEARPLGIALALARTADDARAALARPISAVVLDLASTRDGVQLLEELHGAHSELPVIVLSEAGEMQDRLDAARFGGRSFLHHPVQASQIMDLLRDVVVAAHDATATIVAVDDDPALLELIQALLVPMHARVIACQDPLNTLAVLEEHTPDLIILDVDMPGLDGIELCRVLRNDPRWAATPVLFLTAHVDPANVTRMFEAGADDFVAKPVLGPELVARVRNRLERVRMMRLAADVDSLTGVSTRHRGIERLERCIQRARRNGQPISIAVIDLDNFKQVNDRYGHVAGDVVLRRFAAVLTSCFRGDDVVARWGGEEFVVGMYGMPCSAAVKRLRQALTRVRDEQIETGDASIRVTFSAGLAEFPRDGADWPALYRLADQALSRAKAEGRDRVADCGQVG